MAHLAAFTTPGCPFAGVYLYQQEDTAAPDAQRFGLLCAVRAEQPESGVVFSTGEELCVETVPCAAYDDPTAVTRQRMMKLTKALRPRWQWEEDNLTHRLWVINDTVTIEALRKDFADRVLRLYAGQSEYHAAVKAGSTQLTPQLLRLFLTETEGLLPPMHQLLRNEGAQWN